MPSVICVANIPEATKNIFVALLTKGNEDPRDIDINEVDPEQGVVPVETKAAANAVRWTYGGATRLCRIGGKRVLSDDELRALTGRGLGGLFQVSSDQAADEADAIAIVLAQKNAVEKERDTRSTELDAARVEAQAHQRRAEASERRVVDLLATIEQQKREIADRDITIKKLEAAAAKKASAKTDAPKTEG